MTLVQRIRTQNPPIRAARTRTLNMLCFPPPPRACGRVKTELFRQFDNADVTSSIHDVSEHAHGSFGITQGHFDTLLWAGRGNFFIWIKKKRFQTIPGCVVWTRPMYILQRADHFWDRPFLGRDHGLTDSLGTPLPY